MSLNETQPRDDIICTYETVEETFPGLDFGSALVSVDNSELIGIASWCDEDAPNVYVRVRPYLPWIKSIISE